MPRKERDGGNNMRAYARAVAEVMSALNRFGEAFLSRDVDRTLSFLAPDPDLVYIGTGVDEKRLGLNEVRVQFERNWAQTEQASIETVHGSVSAAGFVAWAASDIIVHAKASGTDVSFPGRLTAVPEHAGERGSQCSGTSLCQAVSKLRESRCPLGSEEC